MLFVVGTNCTQKVDLTEVSPGIPRGIMDNGCQLLRTYIVRELIFSSRLLIRYSRVKTLDAMTVLEHIKGAVDEYLKATGQSLQGNMPSRACENEALLLSARPVTLLHYRGM